MKFKEIMTRKAINQGYKNWKNAMIMLIQGTIMVAIMVCIPMALVFGMFGLAFGTEFLVSLILNRAMQEFTLEWYSLFVGVFTGCSISFLWGMWVYSKTKMFKKHTKDNGVPEK